MRPHRAWLCLILLILLNVAPGAVGYDNRVYDELKRSRDALLAQQAELGRAEAAVKQQIDSLNDKLVRITQYQRQVNLALNDVEAVMRSSGR